MHFDSVKNIKVVEIGRSSATDEETVEILRALVRTIGAEPVVCRDRPGLVVDALLMPHLMDAVRMLDEGYADMHAIMQTLQKVKATLRRPRSFGARFRSFPTQKYGCRGAIEVY